MDTDSISKEEEISSTEPSHLPSSEDKVDDTSYLTETNIQRSEHPNEENISKIESTSPDDAGKVAQSIDTKTDAEIDSSDNTYQENDSEEINIEENIENQSNKPSGENNPLKDETEIISSESNDRKNLNSLTTSGDDDSQISITKENAKPEPISDVTESETFSTYQEQTEKHEYETQSTSEELDSLNATPEGNLVADSTESEANIQTEELTENICAKEERNVSESNEEISVEKTVSELASAVKENQEESLRAESSTENNESTENENAGRDTISANEDNDQIITEEKSESELASTNNELSQSEDIRERAAGTTPEASTDLNSEIIESNESDLVPLVTDLRKEENSETESTSFSNENAITNLEAKDNSESAVTSDNVESVSEKSNEHQSVNENKTNEKFSVTDESKITDTQEIYETNLTGNAIHEEETTSKENVKEDKLENESSADELHVNKPLYDSKEENSNENILSSNKEHQVVEQKEEELKPDYETFTNADLEVGKITEHIIKNKPEHDNSISQNTESNHENKPNLCDADSQINRCCNNQCKNKLSETESTHNEVCDNTLEEKVSKEENPENESSVVNTKHSEKLEGNIPEVSEQECDSCFVHEENQVNESDKGQIKSEANSDVIANESQENAFTENVNKEDEIKTEENSDITDSQVNISSEERVKEQIPENESTFDEIQTNNIAESCPQEHKSDSEQIPDKPTSINNDLDNEVFNETLNSSQNLEVALPSNVEENINLKTSAEEQTSDADLQKTSTSSEHWEDANYYVNEYENNELTENLKNNEKTESETKSEFQKFKNTETFFQNETNEIESIAETIESKLDKITQHLVNNTNSDETMINAETEHQLNINNEGTERENITPNFELQTSC